MAAARRWLEFEAEGADVSGEVVASVPRNGTPVARSGTAQNGAGVAAGSGTNGRHGADGATLPTSLREVCHDLRQPIATIGALAEALLTSPDLPKGLEVWVTHIVREARVLADLVQQVGSRRLEPVPLSPARLLADVAAEAAVTYDGVITISAVPHPEVVADAVALRRALTNVVDNAARAAGPTGTVGAELTANNGHVVFEIGDSGPGFGAAPPGMGTLGLDIASRLMHAQGGTVELGRSPLGGALVRLVLPVNRGGVGATTP